MHAPTRLPDLPLNDCAMILYALGQLIAPGNRFEDMTLAPETQQGLSRLFNLLGDSLLEAGHAVCPRKEADNA